MSDYQYPTALPVTTTGGWARPGWFDILAGAQQEGRFGPADRQELLDDYCQLAICDQERLIDLAALAGDRPAPHQAGRGNQWDQAEEKEACRDAPEVH